MGNNVVHIESISLIDSLVGFLPVQAVAFIACILDDGLGLQFYLLYLMAGLEAIPIILWLVHGRRRYCLSRNSITRWRRGESEIVCNLDHECSVIQFGGSLIVKKKHTTVKVVSFLNKKQLSRAIDKWRKWDEEGICPMPPG